MGVHNNKMTPTKNENNKNKNNIKLNKNDNNIMTPIMLPLLPHTTQRHYPHALTYLQINHNNDIKTQWHIKATHPPNLPPKQITKPNRGAPGEEAGRR